MARLSGINTHIPSTSQIDLVSNLRCEWIRIDIDWDMIEKREGSFNFSSIDKAVQYAKSKQLKIFGTIAYTPSWMNADRRSHPNLDKWRIFVQKVASRYSNRIDALGIWNEPNLKEFYKGSIDDYKNLLEIGWTVIKSVNPRMIVIAGELSTMSGSNWYKYLKLLKTNPNIYDVCSIHSYKNSWDALKSAFNVGAFFGIAGWFFDKSLTKFIWLFSPYSFVFRPVSPSQICFPFFLKSFKILL